MLRSTRGVIDCVEQQEQRQAASLKGFEATVRCVGRRGYRYEHTETFPFPNARPAPYNIQPWRRPRGKGCTIDN